MVGVHVMHSKYWQSHFGFGASPPCCPGHFLCKQAIFRKQTCCNARPLEVFYRHGHSCCLFRCCPQTSVQTRSVQDGYCVSPLLHSIVWPPGDVDWTSPWHEILPLLGMLTTDCNQHQEFSTQIGGYFATAGLPFQGDWNTLTVSYHRLLVTQQDIEVFTNRIYIALMFYNADCFDQWWGHLAM